MTKADDGLAPDSTGASQPAMSRGVGVAELTHATVRGQFSEYLDRTLDERDRQRVDRHLAMCPECVAFLETLAATTRAIGQLPHHRAPESARARVLDAVRREAAEARGDA